MSGYLYGCDVVVGDVQVDALALKQAEERKRAAADTGGWTLGNFITIGVVGLLAVIVWPHMRKWF